MGCFWNAQYIYGADMKTGSSTPISDASGKKFAGLALPPPPNYVCTCKCVANNGDLFLDSQCKFTDYERYFYVAKSDAANCDMFEGVACSGYVLVSSVLLNSKGQVQPPTCELFDGKGGLTKCVLSKVNFFGK